MKISLLFFFLSGENRGGPTENRNSTTDLAEKKI